MSQPQYVYIVWRKGCSYDNPGGEIIRAFAAEPVAVAFARLLNGAGGEEPVRVTKTLTGYTLEDLIPPPELLE